MSLAFLGLVACVGEVGDGYLPGDASPTRDGGANRDGAVGPGLPDGGLPSPPDAADSLYDQLDPAERELFDLINAERSARGLTPVVLRDTLVCAAARHSDDIGTTYSCSHTGSDFSQPGDRVAGCGGGGWTGEIVACGQDTPRAAVDAWLLSPGHATIMLGGSKREVGVAMTNDYWTAIFDD